MAAGETEGLIKNEVIFDCFAFFISLYTSLCGAMPVSFLCLNFRPVSSRLEVCFGNQSIPLFIFFKCFGYLRPATEAADVTSSVAFTLYRLTHFLKL
jgi:hypothetical protein